MKMTELRANLAKDFFFTRFAQASAILRHERAAPSGTRGAGGTKLRAAICSAPSTEYGGQIVAVVTKLIGGVEFLLQIKILRSFIL
jgi:hypothetical protein